MNATLDAHDIQALVFSGHGRLRQSLALGLAVADRAAARASLAHVLRQRTSFGLSRGERQHAAQVLVSAAGLAALGGSDAAAGLDTAFREGIVTPQRSRALGDAGRNDPAGWSWRDTGIHALLLVYAPTEATLHARRDELLAELAGWTTVLTLPICLPHDNREPFGFRDGVTSIRVDVGDGSNPPPGTDLVPPGEILLGQRAADGTVAPPPPLGVHGTYVIVRQLEQDVEGFWKFWRSQGANDQEAVWLAAKALGRWPNGMPMEAGPPMPEPPSHEAAVMRALSFDGDRLGRGCPFGAHIRRANPRDALETDPAISRQIVAQHRILRRGRMYGAPAPAAWYPKLVDRPELDTEVASTTPGRGLLFMCLCGDIARQFEFVQQTWLNNPKFADLYDEADPMAAGEGMPTDSRRFSIPADPVRRRLHAVQRWVTVRGGGYFLLPGRQAMLDWLAE